MGYDLRPLKQFVMSQYREGHPLQVINQEKDRIEDTREFLAKVEIWLRLSHQ